MKIILYLKIFPPRGKPLNWGISKAVDGLAFGLAECENQVTVLCEGNQESSIKTEKGYDIKCFTNCSKKWQIFSLASSLKKYIQEKGMTPLQAANLLHNDDRIVHNHTCSKG